MDKSEKKESFGKKYGLILALIAMAIVYLFPTPVDLPTQGTDSSEFWYLRLLFG